MKIGAIKMDGLRELDAALAQLGKKVATEIAEDAVRGSAELLRNAWEVGAPFDPAQAGASKIYGHLRANIRVKFVQSANANVVAYAVTTGRAYWGNFLEYGTARMRARPWARPIVDRMRGTIVARQEQILRAGIEQAMAGVSK